jgi:hypothetical protein
LLPGDATAPEGKAGRLYSGVSTSSKKVTRFFGRCHGVVRLPDMQQPDI